MKATFEEERAIDFLRLAARCWPNSLWLFSASGVLNVMRKTEENNVAISPSGGYDPNYIIAIIDGIPNDGGDW